MTTPSTLDVAPSTIVCRLASGDLLDATPLQAGSLIFDGIVYPVAVIAADDLVLIQDTDNAGSLATVTTQSIADLIGAGDVQGPAVATDLALVRFDSTTGKLIKNGVGILTDAGALSGLTTINMSGALTVGGLVDGRDIAADGGVLDGIEPGADITDLANVSAALVLGTSIGIGTAAVGGSILTLNTTTSPLEFVESVFNAGLTVPAGTISGYLAIEIGGNVLYINAYSVIPS